MFDAVLESLRKSTEMGIQTQQEMFKKWVEFWPVPVASPGNWSERLRDYQTKWSEMAAESLKKQREMLEVQFDAGMKNIEAAFAVAEARDMDELRGKATELWKKSFDCLRQTFEAQVKSQQALVSKWMELMLKHPAS